MSGSDYEKRKTGPNKKRSRCRRSSQHFWYMVLQIPPTDLKINLPLTSLPHLHCWPNIKAAFGGGDGNGDIFLLFLFCKIAVFDKDIVFCEGTSEVWVEWPGKAAVCPTEALMCCCGMGWVSREARSRNVGHFIFIHYIMLWEVLQRL